MRRYIYLILIIIFTSCKNNYIYFIDYMNSFLINSDEIIENELYIIHEFNYKARVIYSELGTHFNIYNTPEGIIFTKIKYWTDIIPIEYKKLDDNIWVNVKIKDNINGWIKSQFIEVRY